MQIKIDIDTREKQAWYFPEGLAKTSRVYLPYGDYRLQGDTGFVIERKSLDDYTASVSTYWRRFERELTGILGTLGKGIVIVEGTVQEIIDHVYNQPQILPKFVMKRTAQIILMGIPVVFFDNPITSAGMAWAILRERSQQIGVQE